LIGAGHAGAQLVEALRLVAERKKADPARIADPAVPLAEL